MAMGTEVNEEVANLLRLLGLIAIQIADGEWAEAEENARQLNLELEAERMIRS